MLYNKEKAEAHAFLMQVLIVKLASNQTPGACATEIEEMAQIQSWWYIKWNLSLL